ncbi:MAG: cpt, partial [Solirubrobacterales bacterium]|nr:cpt [Solirubrobacterales bacterium]
MRSAALAVLLAGVCASGAAGADRISTERVPLRDPAVQVPRLEALGLDVTEDVGPHAAMVVASSDAERARLRAAGFSPVTQIADYGAVLAGRRTARARSARIGAAAVSGLPSGRTRYRTPAEVQADLDALVAGHPGLVRKVVLPRRSIDGRPITGVEIASDVEASGDGRPVYVVMGLHHAREWPSAEIATEFALDLVAHQTEPRVAALLAGLRIVVVPVVNPDGYQYSRGSAAGGQLDPVAALKRRNCRADAGDPPGGSCAQRRGVDLNRNYGAYW